MFWKNKIPALFTNSQSLFHSFSTDFCNEPHYIVEGLISNYVLVLCLCYKFHFSCPFFLWYNCKASLWNRGLWDQSILKHSLVDTPALQSTGAFCNAFSIVCPILHYLLETVRSAAISSVSKNYISSPTPLSSLKINVYANLTSSVLGSFNVNTLAARYSARLVCNTCLNSEGKSDNRSLSLLWCISEIAHSLSLKSCTHKKI